MVRGLLLLQSTGSRCTGSVVVAHGLGSCGAWASLLCGMWDLPGPGLEPVSPALAGGFLTTAPPGKFLFVTFDYEVLVFENSFRPGLKSSPENLHLLLLGARRHYQLQITLN